MNLYCCGCESDIKPRLTNGAEIYPNRSDLFELPFWKCDKCNNFVGCHHKTKNRTSPLGCIPTKELREARKQIHKLIDPIWKSGATKRKYVYQKLSDALGYKYHTANIKSIDEARTVWKTAVRIFT